MLPMIAAIGCAIDYSNASMIRTKLQAAADAAVLATVSLNSPVVATSKSMTGNGTVSGGSTYAANFFSANLPSGYSVTPTATVTLTGTTVTAVMSFSTSVSTYFMGIVGYPSITIGSSSTASYTLPTYIDFYLMLDVSGSMSFPSTTAEQQDCRPSTLQLCAVPADRLHRSLAILPRRRILPAKASTSNQGPIPAAGHSYAGYIPNPNPGRILPRVYHFALRHHAGSLPAARLIHQRKPM